MDTESRRRCRRGGVGGRNGWGVRGTDFKWPEKQVVGSYLLYGVGNTATNTVSAVRWQVLTRLIGAIVSQCVRMWDRYVAHVELMWYLMSVTLPWWKKEAFQGSSFISRLRCSPFIFTFPSDPMCLPPVGFFLTSRTEGLPSDGNFPFYLPWFLIDLFASFRIQVRTFFFFLSI